MPNIRLALVAYRGVADCVPRRRTSCTAYSGTIACDNLHKVLAEIQMALNSLLRASSRHRRLALHLREQPFPYKGVYYG